MRSERGDHTLQPTALVNDAPQGAALLVSAGGTVILTTDRTTRLAIRRIIDAAPIGIAPVAQSDLRGGLQTVGGKQIDH